MRRPRVVVAAIVVMLLVSTSLALAQAPPPPLTPLPPPPQPAGNPVTTAKANLGKTLFWDEQVSSTRTVACGSCHQASSGGSDPRSQRGSGRATNPGPDGTRGTADDITGSPGVVLNAASGMFAYSSTYGLAEQVTSRLAPSHINAAYVPQLFWDGRAGQVFVDPQTGQTLLPAGGALENQVLAPPVSSTEMGHIGRDWADVAARVAASAPLVLSLTIPASLAAWINGRSYAQLFAEAFGSPDISGARIALAIASYERTQFSTQTPFDSVIAGTAQLTPQEDAGRRLFGTLPCARCHAGALLSNNAFHYIGVRPATEDSGRAAVTHNPADLGAMRTPSLRNVALRHSYMHDGRFATLAEVVDFYDRGGDFSAPNKDPLITPLNLTPLQKAQLVAFLGRPLTDPRVANGQAPFDHPSLFSESSLVPAILANGVPGGAGSPPQPVALEPPLAGNSTFTIGVFGALGGAHAVLVLDEAEPPATGGIPASGSFARLEATLEGSGPAAGFGSATLVIPNDTQLYGRTLYGRWYVEDPGASGGVAASPSFRMQIFGPNGAGLLLAVTPPAAGTEMLRLSTSQPNPFGQGTVVRFALAVGSNVRLMVYDVTGRAVRRLVDRHAALPGEYAVSWDGRDDAGHEVPGGVYFYRLETDRGAKSSRVVRLQ